MEQPLPQFLDLQPKVAGPFTFKQLIFVAGIGVIILILFTMMPMGTFLLVAIPLAGLALFLAFGKIRGFPAPTVLARSFGFLFAGKVYVWKKKGAQAELPVVKKAEKVEVLRPQASMKLDKNSKLEDLKKIIEISG
ncbi:MAG: hypothetical protein PHS27_00580 [Candidatus Pacebacteria bacterium]|nr:hypothetical protein [Candidatus Paceibacterota bacterium]